MILSPITENIATLSPAADYTVMLPDVRLNLETAKTISAAKTISGGASVTVWAANVAGESRAFDVLVSDAIYRSLKKIKATMLDEWLLRVGGRIFTVIYDMPSAMREKGDVWRCNISLTFLTEVSR